MPPDEDRRRSERHDPSVRIVESDEDVLLYDTQGNVISRDTTTDRQPLIEFTAADLPEVSMRISSGPSAMNEKPRSAAVS